MLVEMAAGDCRIPVSVAFGPPLPPTSTAAEVRQAIQKLSADCAIAPRRIGAGRSTAVRPHGRPAPVSACLGDTLVSRQGPQVRRGAGRRHVLARRLRPMLGDDDRMVGVWLPPSVGGAVTNIALALLGKTSVNLNYTSVAGSGPVGRAAVRLRHVLTSRLLHHQDASSTPDPASSWSTSKTCREGRHELARLSAAFLTVVLLPACVLRALAVGPAAGTRAGRPGHGHLLQRQHRRAQGRDADHGNIAANAESMIQAIDLAPRRPRPGRAAVLPQLRLHRDALGAAAGRRLGLSTTPTRGRPRRSASCARRSAAPSSCRRRRSCASACAAASRTISRRCAS